MAESSHSSVLQLAEHLSAGFLALSGEYQILFDQQRQLESRLVWAKQQVCQASLLSYTTACRMMNPLALDLQSPSGLDR